MALTIELSDPHDKMVERLRDEHGDDIDSYLRQRVEAEIHESYQQLREDGHQW